MSDSNINAVSAARSRMNAKTVTALAMLTAITYVVMYLSKLLPQLYGFLQLEVKGTVVCIGGFIFGPMAAAGISVVVAAIEMFTVSDTGPIGCIMNCLAACAFACPAAFIYKRLHTRMGAVIGLGVGVLTVTVVMMAWNYLLVPIYTPNISREAVFTMLPTVFLPFNLVKGGLNMGLTLVLYKPVVTALRRAHLVPESQAGGKNGMNVGFLLFSLVVLATFVAMILVLTKAI